MSHKGSKSRIQDQKAARETWERVFGSKRTSEPPRAHTDTEAKPIPDPPEQNERADSAMAGTTDIQHDGLGEANDNQ